MRAARPDHSRAHAHARAPIAPRHHGRAHHALLGDGPMAGVSWGPVVTDVPPDAVLRGPLEQGDQGISPAEREHAEQAIRALFAKAGGVNWIATWDQADGTYEIRSRTGSLKWQRYATPDGGLLYKVVSLTGENPVTNVDPTAVRTLEEEIAAAGGPEKPVPESIASYPDVIQRITQLFDSRRAPDFVYIPTGGGDPNHPRSGSHGIPDATQSRAPLIMAGPGIAPNQVTDTLARSVDVAPTVAQFIGIRLVLGTNASGVRRLQLLKWQDGHSLASSVADVRFGAAPYGTAQRVLVFVLDGGSQTVLLDEVKQGKLPNIARLMRMGVTFRNGSVVDYPTVTYANHNTLTTGASPGHQGILNNSWYNRETGSEKLITDGPVTNSLRAGRYMNPQVETLYEAARRTWGADAVTMALNEPSGRGSTIATLDLNGVGRLLSNLFGVARHFLSLRGDEDKQPGGAPDKDYHSAATMDRAGIAIAQTFFDKPNTPRVSVFELSNTDTMGHKFGPNTPQGRASFEEADRNIGRMLEQLDREGLTDSSMFVVTADHGMEHGYTDPAKLGGWFDALRTSGVKTVESTRFVYVKNVRFDVHGDQPRAGQASTVAVRVINDDVNDKGFRPAVAGAQVTLRDDAGHEFTGYTDGTGVAHVQVTPSAAGHLQLSITHPAFTTETSTIPVADASGTLPKRRREHRDRHHG